MARLKRNERIASIAHTLTNSPGKMFTLNSFCQLFDVAKSSVSEDLEVVRVSFEQGALGTLKTFAGPSGGVMYLPSVSKQQAVEGLRSLCEQLGEPSRILPGNFLYIQDILSDPQQLHFLSRIMAMPFYEAGVDFVLTVETKGIPFAMATARVLGVPLIIARRDYRTYEGTVVTINHALGGGQLQSMSLARRAIAPTYKKALIVDDFMHAGGTLRGMADLLYEFNIQLAGSAVIARRVIDVSPLVDNVHALVEIGASGHLGGEVSIAPWVYEIE